MAPHNQASIRLRHSGLEASFLICEVKSRRIYVAVTDQYSTKEPLEPPNLFDIQLAFSKHDSSRRVLWSHSCTLAATVAVYQER
jgi:hypothetical protein